ncbi:MAG: Fis family transcriptional regulator [Holosporaceae bacterium]|jgi:two-component system nitrogen regulation response regulator GlnG|nr:Fis family transcriptional regulator [Holosporaceae bacterium]
MVNKKNPELLENGLSNILRQNLEKYFDSHNDDVVPPGLYNRVIGVVEQVMFEVTLEHVSGNCLRAAKILGINRNTLRKKIAKEKSGDIHN